MIDKHSDFAKKKKSQKNMDWENRVLCSDGNCIGVIGWDGRCKECGRPYEGQLPWQIKSTAFDENTETQQHEDVSDAEEKPVKDAGNQADQMSQEDYDWEGRRLCSDGNCIGVIGPDGRCKECGKPYEGD